MISENVKKILEKLENYSVENNLKFSSNEILIPLSDGTYLSLWEVYQDGDNTFTVRLYNMQITPSSKTDFCICNKSYTVIRNLSEAEYILLNDSIQDVHRKIQDAFKERYMSLL